MKKINIVFLFVLLFTLLFTTNAMADSYNSGVVTIDTNWSGTLQQAVIDAGGSNVYLITELHITSAVTNTLTTDDIAYIKQMSNIKVLDVADTVTAGDVGDNFLSYSGVTTVNFAATTFRNDSFYYCSSLTTVSLPKATTFGHCAFDYCKALTSVSLPLAETFGSSVFANSDAITSITLPKATTFGTDAFNQCKSLSSIDLPEARIFGNSAFTSCKALTTINLPKATAFGTNTFSGCSSLATITLPKVTTMGASSITQLGALTTVDMPVITAFGDYAFRSCSKLATVNLPKAATFGTGVFGYCSTLTSINLPEATTFGDEPFIFNTLLETVTMPKATTFGEMAFRDCPALINVNLPKASSFTDYAFTSCGALESISLPELKSIGSKGFLNCSNLTQVSLPMIESFGNDTFDGNFKRIKLILGATVPTTSNTSFKAFNLLSANAYLIVPTHMEAAYDSVDGMDGYFRGFHINPIYNITYNGNGSTSGSPPDDGNNPYLEYHDVTVLGRDNLQKNYYTFSGWNTQIDGHGYNYLPGFTISIESDTVLYANWTPTPYTITYHQSDETYYSIYTIETSVTFFIPSKDGYVFCGWYTDSACSDGNRMISTPEGSSGDIDLWPKWELKPYNISYNVSPGTNHPTNPATYTILDTITFSDPTRDHYTFGGWYTNSSCTTGNETSGISVGTFGHKDIYPKWIPIPYAIAYRLNGGTNHASNPAIYTIEDNPVFSSPSKTGYTFGGWYTDSGCTAGNEITEITLGSTGNITVYAKWTVIPYTITYHLDDGTNSPSNPDSYTIEDYVMLSSPSKTGYTFDGWHTEPITNSEVFGIGIGSTDNVTLYARWTPISYNINYQLDGGTNHPSNPATYTIEEVVTLNVPSKYGYTFSGWYTDSALSEGNEITEIAVGSTGDKAVYAKWIPIPVSSVQFAKESETFTVGITTSIGYSLLPIDAANKNVSYSSSNTDIATVDASGMITALKQGITLITISSQENPAIYDTLLLTVSEPATPEPPETFSATIKGKLIDSTGVPLAHYPITLCSDPQTVITGSDGSFEFTGVPLTSHTLIVNNTTTNELGRFAINFKKGTTNSSTIDNGLKEIDVAFTSRTLSIDVTLQTNPMLTDFSAAAIGYKVKPPDAKVENPCTGYFE